MKTFINVLLEECKKNIERTTGKEAANKDVKAELGRIFKVAGITKQNKYKIINGYKTQSYQISRRFAISLGLAFEFNVDEMNTFLAKAGHYLSEYHLADRIIVSFIKKGDFKITNIDEALYENDLPLLAFRS